MKIIGLIKNIFINKKTKSVKYRSRFSHIGIDLGSSQIKVVQLEQKLGKLTIYQRVSHPTPLGLIENGKIMDIDKLSQILKQLRHQYPWRKNLVNLCLCPQTFYFARVKLPPMKNNDLNRAMRCELEKRFPLNAEDAVFSFCAASETEQRLNRLNDYFLIAAGKEIAAAYTEAVNKAGFKTLSLEISPFSLVRNLASFQSNSDHDENHYSLILDIGKQDSTVIIIDKGTFCFYRNLRIGTKHFSPDAKNTEQSSSDSGRRFNRVKIDPENLSSLKTAKLFASRLRQSVDFWLEQSGQTSSHPGLLNFCGGGVYISGLPSFLGKSLKMKPSLYSPIIYTDQLSKTVSKSEAFSSAIYATAYGLALRGWTR